MPRSSRQGTKLIDGHRSPAKETLTDQKLKKEALLEKLLAKRIQMRTERGQVSSRRNT